jgi:hypothetical protein
MNYKTLFGPILFPEEQDYLAFLMDELSEDEREFLKNGGTISELSHRRNIKFSSVARRLLPAIINLKKCE